MEETIYGTLNGFDMIFTTLWKLDLKMVSVGVVTVKMEETIYHANYHGGGPWNLRFRTRKMTKMKRTNV